MKIYPSKYSKKGFLEFLKHNNVNTEIINKFNELPETVERNNNVFTLDINSIWYNKGETYYEFELNYYSEELVEYLFSTKVFNDVEVSVNYLNSQLNANKVIKK